VDLETHAAPAFDVLVTSCQPVDLYAQPSGGPPAMMYPAQLPFSTTLELANRPILAAIQSSLVPVLPPGHYVTAVRERLDVLMTSGRSFSGRTPNAGDGRIATLLVTLPVRFRGGDLVIRSHFDGRTERFHHSKKGHSGQLEWVAWTEGSEVEIETIKKGCRVDLRFGIYLQSFGPGGSQLEPLITPPEDFRSLLGAVLNLSRGRRIGFYLTKEYGVNPAEASAASLIPMVSLFTSPQMHHVLTISQLSGGDMLLYEALRMFELVPELHWTAGGYIWPADRVVDMTAEPPSHSPNSSLRRRSGHSPPSSTVRGAFAPYGMPVPQGEADEVERLKVRVEAGGASPLATADIMVLADWDDSQAGGGAVAGKERVSFVSGGELGRLVVHVLLVVYVA
jgi:hypothetical protein